MTLGVLDEDPAQGQSIVIVSDDSDRCRMVQIVSLLLFETLPGVIERMMK